MLVGTIDIHAIDMGWAFPGKAEGDESAVEAAAGSDARINALASKRAGDKATNSFENPNYKFVFLVQKWDSIKG